MAWIGNRKSVENLSDTSGYERVITIPSGCKCRGGLILLEAGTGTAIRDLKLIVTWAKIVIRHIFVN